MGAALNRAGVRGLIVGLLLALWGNTIPAARGMEASSPTLRCRGSTRARVHIRWPGRAELAGSRTLHLGVHVPASIARWAYLVVPDARAQGIDPLLVTAVIRVESDGDPLAWNLDSDARGLMQVLHAPFDPASNLAQGIAMLGGLQRQFGKQDLALAGYNAGPGYVQQYGGVPPFPETRDYIVMVDYFHDLYAGHKLPAARVRAFKAAIADLRAFRKRECGKVQ